MKMRNHCRKLASLVEQHETRANTAESSLRQFQQRRKAASSDYLEIIRVPRRGRDSILCGHP